MQPGSILEVARKPSSVSFYVFPVWWLFFFHTWAYILLDDGRRKAPPTASPLCPRTPMRGAPPNRQRAPNSMSQGPRFPIPCRAQPLPKRSPGGRKLLSRSRAASRTAGTLDPKGKADDMRMRLMYERTR